MNTGSISDIVMFLSKDRTQALQSKTNTKKSQTT